MKKRINVLGKKLGHIT